MSLDRVTSYFTNQIQIHASDKRKVEDFARVLFFVQQEVSEAAATGGITPVRDYITTLLDLNNETVLEIYLKKVIQDTKTAEKDPVFKNVMRDLYNGLRYDQSIREGQIREVNGNFLSTMQQAQSPVCTGLVVAFSRIPPSALPQVLQSLETMLPAGTNWMLVPARGAGQVVHRVGGKVASVGLAAVQLSYAAIKNILAWWRGEITGKRCAKNVIDSVASIGGGFGGAYAGATIGGAVGGPVGAIIGGVGGAIGGAIVCEDIVSSFTCRIFDLPKDAALEKAYNYLGVSQRADNASINSAYRKLALKHHPDRGGKQEDFIELQIQMSIIKMARGQVL